MANKRMFNIKVTDSDAFLDMPTSTQCLYFHLNMHADDDGFIGNPKRVGRMVGSNDDDLKLLIAKRFVLAFDDGVIVIKHWRLHNTLQSDRYTKTLYTDELNQLSVKENKAYTFDKAKAYYQISTNGNKLETNWKQNVSADIDIDKDIDLDKGKKHKYGEYSHVLLTDTQLTHLKELFNGTLDSHIKILDEYIEITGKKYKNHSLVIQGWVHDKYLKEKPTQDLDEKFYEKKQTQSKEEIEAETRRVQELLKKGL